MGGSHRTLRIDLHGPGASATTGVGGSWELEAPSSSTFGDLKLHAASLLGMPHRFLRLSVRGAEASTDRPPSDRETLGAHQEDHGDVLEVDVALTWEPLSSESWEARLRGVQELSDAAASRGNPNMVAQVSRLLGDPAEQVRRAATELLGRVAEKGDRSVLAAAGALLDNGNSSIRASAMVALKAVAEKGDSKVVAAACKGLDDADWSNRLKAIEALCEVAARGDMTAFASVCLRVGDPNWAVRHAAVRAVALLAELGDLPPPVVQEAVPGSRGAPSSTATN